MGAAVAIQLVSAMMTSSPGLIPMAAIQIGIDAPAIGQDIHKHRLCPQMNDGCGGGNPIGVSHDDLITRADSHGSHSDRNRCTSYRAGYPQTPALPPDERWVRRWQSNWCQP